MRREKQVFFISDYFNNFIVFMVDYNQTTLFFNRKLHKLSIF
ncbi:hypothetical protein RCH33_1616 [Flavobacterium daejeonense]|nr:hypothetical protein RCH33_1616 [Flavobacterium daejeonense]